MGEDRWRVFFDDIQFRGGKGKTRSLMGRGGSGERSGRGAGRGKGGSGENDAGGRVGDRERRKFLLSAQLSVPWHISRNHSFLARPPSSPTPPPASPASPPSFAPCRLLP
eukprot:375223-Hanusia_phi.AAC.1